MTVEGAINAKNIPPSAEPAGSASQATLALVPEVASKSTKIWLSSSVRRALTILTMIMMDTLALLVGLALAGYLVDGGESGRRITSLRAHCFANMARRLCRLGPLSSSAESAEPWNTARSRSFGHWTSNHGVNHVPADRILSKGDFTRDSLAAGQRSRTRQRASFERQQKESIPNVARVHGARLRFGHARDPSVQYYGVVFFN